MHETAPLPGSLAAALAAIPDPRRAHLRVHDLVPLLQFAVAALLCGCHSLYAMAQWGQERREDDPDLLIELGLRPGRSPSVATLHRVFKRLDVAAFERALGDWLARSGIAPAEPLAVDGKTLRGVHGEGIPGAHLVSVYAPRARAVLAQIRTAAKGGELAAPKEALAQVDLPGRGEMGGGADPEGAGYVGRAGEVRQPWPHLQQLYWVRRERTVKGVTTVETGYGITSVGRRKGGARRFLRLNREYWGIENGLHWVR